MYPSEETYNLTRFAQLNIGGENVVASRDAARGAMVAQSTVACVVDLRFEALQDRGHGDLQAWRYGVTLDRRPI